MNISQTFPSLAKQSLAIPNLALEEESSLWQQYKGANSKESRERIKRRIMEAHLKMCVSAAAKWTNMGLNFDDLFGAGTVGLSKAFKKYKPNHEQGARFGTYARWWIEAEVQAFAMQNVANVKMGTTVLEKHLFFNYNKILARLTTEHPDADIDTLHGFMADEWMVSQSKKPKKANVIKAIKNFLAKRESTVSLDTPVSADDTRNKIDFIAGDAPDAADLLEEQSELEHRREILVEALSVLKDRERDILYARRLAEPVKTLEELSEVHGVSRERIRQIEIRAFEKLQVEMRRLAREKAVMPEITPSRVRVNSSPVRIVKRRPVNDNESQAPQFEPQSGAVIPKKFSPKRIGASKLKAVWSAHVARYGMDKENKLRDWDCYERFTLKRKPITKKRLAIEHGVSGTHVGRSIVDVKNILSDIFKGRAVDDVVSEAEDLLKIWNTPYLLSEVERRFFVQNPFSNHETASRAWDYFVKHHVQTPNMLMADVAKEYGLNHATITMSLKKAMPVILDITRDFAQEIRQAPLMGERTKNLNGTVLSV